MKALLTSLFLMLCFGLSAQHYSKVKILFDAEHTIAEVAALGLEYDHGHYAPMQYLINDFSAQEIQQLTAAGFSYEILIEDVEEYYRNPPSSESASTREDDCAPDNDYITPANFSLGSFLGYFTYEEMLEQLDNMAELYPDLISVRQPIGDFTTHEGRPIYWIRISDNPDQDEDEPEALYTALHHAREPAGLSQLIYFMWYLLENYDNDDQLRYLVDHSELYFVPCINPDGYNFNVQQQANGGSFLWRKNRFPNFDGTIGVDLNRNYGYAWGGPAGSSGEPNSSTYRGTEPFSEPETQAIRQLCIEHEFKLALNYHTFGNLLLHPWGHITVDADPNFGLIADLLTRENKYVSGNADALYVTNGDSDDWMFGDDQNKPPIYSFTPEVGNAFYPSSSQIISMCRENIWQNIGTAMLLHNYSELTPICFPILSELDGQIKFTLNRYGLNEAPTTVRIEPMSDNILAIAQLDSFDMAPFSSVDVSTNYILDPDIAPGDLVRFRIIVNEDAVAVIDTITSVFGYSALLINENGNSIDNWTSNLTNMVWGVTEEDFYTPPSSLTDSPNGPAPFFSDNSLISLEPVEIPDNHQVQLQYFIRWDLQSGDFARVMISTNGSTFTPLCGLHSQTINNAPAYAGKQTDWLSECIDLSEYAGESIWLRFLVSSLPTTSSDGLYIDNLTLVSAPTPINTSTSFLTKVGLDMQCHPNPVQDALTIRFNQLVSDGRFHIMDARGKMIYTQAVQQRDQLELSVAQWPAGLYFCALELEDGKRIVRKVVVE